MKELKWIAASENEAKVLHYRHDGGEWKPYTAHPLKQPDSSIVTEHGTPSKGFHTAQHLMKLGYVYAPVESETPVNMDSV